MDPQKPALELTWKDVRDRVRSLAKYLKENHPTRKTRKIWGVPRDGCVPAAMMVDMCHRQGEPAEIVDQPHEATVIVDDVIDSGATRDHCANACEDAVFLAVVDKLEEQITEWVQFPWEDKFEDATPTDAVIRMLEYIGEDPKREGLLGTPKRVVKSWKEIYGGYDVDIGSLLTTFEDGACDEMVILKDIEFYTNCEHHMQPFFGKAHIAYLPDKRVIGVSKLARILDVFSRRLQIQERLGQQITEALMTHLRPKGAACVIEAKHFCMVCRGVKKQNSKMITSSLKGAFKDDATTRAELMNLIK